MNKRLLYNLIGIIVLVILFIIIITQYYNFNIDFNQIYVREAKFPSNLDKSDPLIFNKIHQEYPKNAYGKEIMYNSIDSGDISVAEGILNDIYQIPRFDEIEIKQITWEEDPYNDRYWRFLFYGFDPEKNLLYAAENANSKDKDKYYAKLLILTNSFIDKGMNKEHAWDDYHSVAFRTMILTDIWWKLRKENRLSEEESIKILKTIKVHGDFLADNSHYEPSQNHGINEANALFLLSVNFPDMPGAEQWYEISKERLNDGLINLIDDDGALIENSPYYHFYALEKYWNLYKYTQKYNLDVGTELKDKINKMTFYAAYILQPNLEVPLLGASIGRKINLAGEYEEIGNFNPNLLYVLSMGESGKIPEQRSINFPNTGETILRSGWGKGKTFTEQTQIIIDNGNYRTSHSDLDALSFNLYAKGMTLLPDSGLYSYEEDDPKVSYFRGTYAHNTIVVDGKNQEKEGQILAGELIEGEDYSYQTGTHRLYHGVEHKRAIMLIEDDLVLIIDQLESNEEHNYEQVFHLLPEGQIDIKDNTVSVSNKEGKPLLELYQLLPNGIALNHFYGQESPPRGLCSSEYKSIIPCEMLSFSQKGKNVKYITAIEIGEEQGTIIRLSNDQKGLYIKKGKKEYKINIEEGLSQERNIIVNNNELPNLKSNKIQSLQNGVIKDLEEFSLNSKMDGSKAERIYISPLDLSNKNLLLKFDVEKINNVDSLEIALSSNKWKGYVKYNLKNSYRPEYDGELITTSIGKGKERNLGGQWVEYGDGFDWSNIDQIKLILSSQYGKEATLNVKEISTIKEQNQGSVIIIFDDGTSSIKPAAEIMNKYDIKGNVAVIGDYVKNMKKGYLTLSELKTLQNEYGWNMVSHSTFHKNAITEYYNQNRLNDFEEEIIKNLIYLKENEINSAPNWYIYPNGATNEAIGNIVKKYYKFARTVQNTPEVYPFGDRLRVKTLSVRKEVSPESVKKAVDDAKNYNLVLFLTFHRTCSSEDCDSENDLKYANSMYSLNDFEEIIKYIKDSGMKVETLSEFDANNGVSTNEIEIQQEKLGQIRLNVDINEEKLLPF